MLHVSRMDSCPVRLRRGCSRCLSLRPNPDACLSLVMTPLPPFHLPTLLIAPFNILHPACVSVCVCVCRCRLFVASALTNVCLTCHAHQIVCVITVRCTFVPLCVSCPSRGVRAARTSLSPCCSATSNIHLFFPPFFLSSVSPLGSSVAPLL